MRGPQSEAGDSLVEKWLKVVEEATKRNSDESIRGLNAEEDELLLVEGLEAEAKAMTALTNSNLALPQAGSPFHRGGLDRSTIRSKRGQRRVSMVQIPNQLSVQGDPGDMQMDQPAPGKLDGMVKAVSTDECEMGHFVPDIPDALGCPMPEEGRSMRQQAGANETEKQGSVVHKARGDLGRKTDHLPRAVAEEQQRLGPHGRPSSVKVDIKTWEERRGGGKGAKLKPMALKCVFSTDI